MLLIIDIDSKASYFDKYSTTNQTIVDFSEILLLKNVV